MYVSEVDVLFDMLHKFDCDQDFFIVNEIEESQISCVSSIRSCFEDTSH
jgi:phosphoribosyl-AMP cyclohydrolase